MRRISVGVLLVALTAMMVACGPKGGPDVSPELRRQYEITIFTDDPDTGRRVLAAIEAMGYTHPENEVLDTPNDEFNIKWGGAPPAVIDELKGIVEPVIHQELFPRHLWGPEKHDVFINLPVCSLGGAFRPETCGQAATTDVDPQYDAQGIPQACGFPQDGADFGSIRMGTVVTLGRHRPVNGDANWVEDMAPFVGRSGRITELFGTDGSGCPVVHVDVDNGDWFWRIRDMKLGGDGGTAPVVRPTTTPSGDIPQECGMTDADVFYGPIRVGTSIKLGKHRAWQGNTNWAESMEPFVGRVGAVTQLAGVDGAGCPLVKVDADGGAWFWRIRDAELSTGGGGGTPGGVVGGLGTGGKAPQSDGIFPQHCGQSDELADYGAAQVGAEVRLGRHREVNGNANWADAMEQWVGKTGKVTEHVGTDSSGCPVVHVDVDGGSWAWRVRDLMHP